MNRFVLLPAVLLAAALLAAAPASAASFTFETDPLAAATPFSSTDSGLTATFSGSAFADPNAFAISYNSTSGPLPLYAGLTGAFLGTSAFSLDPSSPLTISFSAPVSSLRLNFALGGSSGALSLATDAGGTATQAGSVPSGFSYAEGILSYAGTAFTRAVLSTAADGLAIDNVLATAAATSVPEPAAFGLLAAGLVGLAVRRRRT